MGLRIKATGTEYLGLVLDTIGEIRKEHQSCTMREIARRLGQTPMMIHRQLRQIQEMGLVDWTDLDGSVHITIKGHNVRKRIEKGTVTTLDELKPRPVSVADDSPALQPAN